MAILGSLELVRKRLPHDPRITPLIDNAVLGAERGAALTQRMLAFARKQELKMEAVDVPSLVRGLMNFLDRTIGPNIEVNMRFPSDLPLAHTDPYQLEAALMNLAVNARDAMPRGGAITISARAERVDAHATLAPGDYIRLLVADTGEGMDEATLARATEPFFTTKGVGKGTGLGLSMVHGLVAQSGGSLTMTSRRGAGTQVELWLPAVKAGTSFARAAEAEHPSHRGQRLRILAVDDDSLVLTNTAAMLDDLGHEVIVASSGKEGLEALQSLPDIDLIISDEIMPNMTGSQFAEAVRQSRPDLPVIITSGYADLTADGVASTRPRLAKPFAQADLATLIREVVESPET
jgi:CheY-like chemotaxis protein/two-component sensor histidine kinase